jgi:adenylate cyclase
LNGFEQKTWDWRERLFARPGRATDRIVTILLDQQSMVWGRDDNGFSWPWPRETWAAVADFCRRAGVKALVFDVTFNEPSNVGMDDDLRFSRALEENGRAVGSMVLGLRAAERKTWQQGAPVPDVKVTGLEDWVKRQKPDRLNFPLATFPIPELAGSFRMLSNTNLESDADGVYRRVGFFNFFDGRVVPSQALAAYLVGNPGEHAVSIRPGLLAVDGYRIPIDAEGRAILRFRGPTLTHPNLSAAAVIQSEVQLLGGEKPNIDPSELRGKYVFFGYSVPDALDLRPTPVAGVYPGVEIHATMLDNMLSGDFLRELSIPAALVLLLVVCAAAGTAVSSVSGAGKSVAVYAAFLPVAPVLGVAAYALGYWLQIIALEAGVAVALVSSSLASYATEGQQKRYIKTAFKQYLSHAVVEELIAHPEKLKLGGERRELSIFFSDLQGFTSISETLSPEELTSLLNEFLTAMTDIIEDEDGTIDKYEGDAIIAFWNAPLAQDDHAARAMRAAMRCQARLAEMRPVLRERAKKDLFMRIGLNSGPAVVGNMGSHKKFNYTMLGDTVNLASRLEGINKQFGTYTMASAVTLERSGGAFPARELSRVAVVGRKEPVTVYEPMPPQRFAAMAEILEVFDRGLHSYYEGRFAEAGGIFSSIAAADPPAAAYAEKCAQLLSSPPQEGWNGVWVMTSK